MKEKFFKNELFISSGLIFKFLMGFLFITTYIRAVGLDGYAVIGLVFSFFNIITGFNLRYYLTLVKYNSDALKNKKKLYVDMFNTLHCSVVFSNLLFIIIPFPIILFLIYKVYDNPDLLVFYVIGLFIFVLNRTIVFLADFIRANRQEKIIQKILVTGLVTEFLLAITLLFVFKLGVISILIAIFFEQAIELFLLYHYINKNMVAFKYTFSINLFLKAFKEFAFQNYISDLLSGVLFWGGLFISTFFLDKVSIGVLSIFYSFLSRLGEVRYSLAYHIIPVFSHEINKNNYNKIREIIQQVTYLLSFIFIISMVFLLTVGKSAFLLVLGSQMKGYYHLFIIMASASLFWITVLPKSNFLFVADVRKINKIYAFILMIFMALEIPLLYSLGIVGVIIAYFIAYSSLALSMIHYSAKLSRTKISLLDHIKTISAFLLIGSTIALYSRDIILNPLLSIISFVIITALIIKYNLKKIIKTTRYIVHSI